MDAANQKLNELGKSSGKTGADIGKMADGFNAAGKMMAAGGALMLAPMVDAVRGAATLQQAMDQVGVAFGITEGQSAAMDAQFREMEDTILEVASSTIFGAQDVSQAAVELGKAGVDFETVFGDIGDATDGAMQGVADFAAATATDLPMAAKIASTMANQWGMSADDMTASFDDLTTVMNSTSLGADDFIGGMANIAPMMKIVGAEFDETAALMGFFKDQGLSAREAGTSITAMLRAAVNPTEKQAAAMDELGLSTADFFEINEQGVEQLRDFPDILDMLNDKTKDLSTTQRLQALANLFGLEAFDAAALGILSETDALRDLNEEMENNTGIAREQSEALTDNLLGAIEELGGSYDVLKSKMGDPFLDPLQAGVEGLTSVVDAAAELDPALLNLVGKFATLTGGLLTFGGIATFGAGKVLDMAETFKKAGLSLPKFAAGLGLAGLAIGAGLLAYETNFLGFGDAVDEAMANANQAMKTFQDTFGETFRQRKAKDVSNLANAVMSFGDALKEATGIDITEQTTGIGKALDVLEKSWQENTERGVDPWVNALESAGDAARSVGWEGLAGGLDQAALAWQAMADKMAETEGEMPLLNRQLSALQAGAETLTGLPVQQFFDDLGTNAANAQDDLTDLKNALGAGDWSEIGQILMRDAPNIREFFDNLGTGITDLQKNIETFDLGAATQGVSDQLGEWMQAASDMILGKGFDSMGGPGEREATDGLAVQLADSLGLSLETLPSLMTDKLASIPNPFEGVQQWLQEGMDEITRFFAPQEMAAGLGGAGMGDTSGISQMFSGMVDGIGAGMDQAVADLGALAEEKKTGFKNALGDFFGPIGQFLFPSEDALASGESMMGDPAKIGEQFGQALLSTFTDPAFEESLRQSVDQMPDEAFQATGGALLGALSKGMTAALDQPAPTTDGSAAGQTMGQQMVKTLADGLTTSLLADGASELFIPVANTLGSTLNTALGQAMTQTLAGPNVEGGRVGAGPTGGIGEKLVGTLATGLTTSILNTPPETFIPVANALGSQLSTAMETSMTAPMPAPGADGGAVTTQGQQMVQGLATGLTESITAAPPEMFVPVSNALGAQLGAAMSLAAQPVQPPGGVGPTAPDSGVGASMVQGLAQGLTDSITAAPVESFVPMSNALGAKLGEAMSMAAQMQPGGVTSGGAVRPDPGIGLTMVEGLATGLQESITATPVETFQPVGAALSTKLGEALQTSMTAPMPAPGADGGATTNLGQGMVEGLATSLTDSIANAPQETFAPVGDALGAKIGETLQTLAEGGGEFDISEQVGTSVGQMLQSGIEQADFSDVGEQLTTQLNDQMTTAIDEVSGQIEEAMSGITEAISEAVSQMGEAIGEATEQVSQAVEDMSASIEDATSAVSDAVSEMQSSVEEAGQAMEEAAQAAAEAASEVGDAAAEAAEAVSQAMSDMAASVSAAAGAIEAAAGQIIAALESIANAASAAGAAIGSALAGGFSGSLGIQSPSKVFIGFGKNIVEGLAIGMGGNNQIVSRGSNALAKQSMSTLANAIGMGSPAKKFMPHGASITQGMLAGMIQEAKGRMQSAMGQMAGAVESGMGKVKSAMASGMERVRSQGQQQATSMGADTATAAAEGMTSEERQAERAARRLWRRAYRELMNGVGAARFLGVQWAREFWLGMLDSSGTLEFAQYVTQQIVGAAEDAVTAAMGAVEGLGTQLEIVADQISGLESEISSLESELAGIDSQIANERVNAVREELRLQQQLTQELQERLKTEVSSAHQAHIRAVQTRSASAMADYEHKLRTAQATDTAIAESKIRETELQATLGAMLKAIEQATKDELAARRAAVVEELALKKAALASETALQAQLLAEQSAAQTDYTQAVIAGSQDRIKQLRRELRDASGADQKAQLRAEIALEQQKIELAHQMAAALQAQAAAGSGEGLAQANAQVQFLSEQLAALGAVDVGSLLEAAASKLGTAASTMSTAASDMSSAAEAMGSMEAAAPVQAATKAAAEFGTMAAVAERGMFSMANKYDEVMAKMNADGEAFQAQFAGMVEKTRGTAEAGGTAIGEALSTGITGRIQEGGKATQSAMVQHLNGAVDETTGEAVKGADGIATAFGAEMRGQMGAELSQVHQQVLGGMNGTVDQAERDMVKGGTDISAALGQSSTEKLKGELPKFQTAMNQGMNDAVRDAKGIAAQGGREVGNDLAAGVQSGLQGATQGIANQAAQTVKDAIQAARQAAQANSPSKRMMDLGDDMGLGLVLGLRGRTGDAEDASATLIHIPLSPTSAGGVTGRRAMQERRGATTQHITIEHLELPGVTNPQEFVEILDRWAAANGVASGR